MAGTQNPADSHADEKTHANTTTYEHANPGALHLAGIQDYSDSHAHQRTHADSLSNKYAHPYLYSHAHTNRHACSSQYSPTDICNYRHLDSYTDSRIHGNSDRAADTDTDTNDYASP